MDRIGLVAIIDFLFFWICFLVHMGSGAELGVDGFCCAFRLSMLDMHNRGFTRDMSYLEKRKKERSLGQTKILKSVVHVHDDSI